MSFPSPVPFVATDPKDKYVVVLPCWGSPYIFGIYQEKSKNNLEMLQKAVMGDIEAYNRKDMIIHPGFSESNARWELARRMLTYQHTRIYVNADGIEKCGVNTGTVVRPEKRVGGCPHLMGDVVLLVPKNFFEVMRINPSSLTLVKNPATSDDGENGSWEFDTDEEAEAFYKVVTQFGWDFNEDNGFCYLAKAQLNGNL